MHDEILDFIRRRFKDNCNWLDGNCYYFAVILKERFPKSIIWYDVTYGHFLVSISDRFYDWTGEIEPTGELVTWNTFKQYDKIQYEVIMRDCVR